MTWYYWIFLGLALLGAELVTPGGFYILFFGLSALLVGALVGLDVGLQDWVQWLLFSVLAVVSLLLLRGPLLSTLKTAGPADGVVDSMIGERALLLEDLAPGATGKVELRGTSWTARNGGPVVLVKGQRCRVERIDGLTLWVTAD